MPAWSEVIEEREVRVALWLSLIAVVGMALTTFFLAGHEEMESVLVAFGSELVLGLAVGVVGCLLAAWIFRVGFGYLRSAVLKLPAVFLVPLAMASLVPSIFGASFPMGLVAIAAYLVFQAVLLKLLFSLDDLEAAVTVFLVFVVRLPVWLTLGGPS